MKRPPMPATAFRPSLASQTLARILEEEGPMAERIRAKLHRSALWRLSTGRRQPRISTAMMLERVTRGRVMASDWDPEG